MSTGPRPVDVYDTTLRDGLQGEGMSLGVDDKLQVARILDAFGVDYIEGGWPGAIPRDTDFFRRAQDELHLEHAVLTAFGATRRAGADVRDDPQVQALLDAGTTVVTVVAKADLRHVEHALHTSPRENLAMVRETVQHLRAHGRRVFLDAEHFFDGYEAFPIHATEVVAEAADAGAEVVVLCDTNGGTQPDRIAEIVEEVRLACDVELGIHCHDDGGCAVANSLLAVAAGVRQVQVTAHGYGERCGNADLFGVVGGLQLKRGVPLVTPEQLRTMGDVAEQVARLTHTPRRPSAAYVGRSAFAHKAGLHASAIRNDASLYQHVDPGTVGNRRRMLVSDMAGRASVQLKAQEFGYELAIDDPIVLRTVDRIKELEQQGYCFDSADASFELLLCAQIDPTGAAPFAVTSWAATVGADASHAGGEATVDVLVADRPCRGRARAERPLDALLAAMIEALRPSFPQVAGLRLTDVSEHTIDPGDTGGTTRLVRVRTEVAGRGHTLATVGVDPDPTAAGWRALRDALTHELRAAVPLATGRGLTLVAAS